MAVLFLKPVKKWCAYHSGPGDMSEAGLPSGELVHQGRTVPDDACHLNDATSAAVLDVPSDAVHDAASHVNVNDTTGDVNRGLHANVVNNATHDGRQIDSDGVVHAIATNRSARH